jgi:phage shock protein A
MALDVQHDALVGAIAVAIISSITSIVIANINRRQSKHADANAGERHEVVTDDLAEIRQGLDQVDARLARVERELHTLRGE